MLARLSAAKAAIGRGLGEIRHESGWLNRSIAGVVAALLGVAGDFLRPWFHLLGLALPAALVALVCGFLAWWLSGRWAAPGATTRWRRFAAFTMYSLVTCAVLVPISALSFAAGGQGFVAQAVPGAGELQDYIDARLDRLDEAIAVLTDTSERQLETLESVSGSMEMSVALNLVDRARETQDGSAQGISAAMPMLLNNGFEFAGSDFSGVNLSKTTLDNGVFSGARLHFVDLRGSSLRGTSFAGSGLRFAEAAEAKFIGADVSGVYAPFASAQGAIFSSANLAKANFFGADFEGAHFDKADMSGASFAFANLRGADLREANLTGAYLIGTQLLGADLRGATFDQTSMLGAIVDPEALTAEQHAGTCAHTRWTENVGVEVTLIERWPSDRYSTGYEFEHLAQLMDSFGHFYVSVLPDDQLLPRCASPTEEAVGFDAEFATSESMHLDRSYLDKAGRRRVAIDRVNAFGTRLAEEFAAGPIFVRRPE